MRITTGLMAMAASVAFAACALDFSKFEGEPASGGGGSVTTTGGGGTGASGGGGTGSTGGMFPVECTNMAMDGQETDVDCGGAECPACENGDNCSVFSDCASMFCTGGTCTACTGDPDCADAPGTYCEGGSCVPSKDDGQGCTAPKECTSGNCVDGLCCDTACGGVCEACTAALTTGTDGTCSPLTGTTDPIDECAGTQVCDGAGTCAAFCGLEPTPVGGTCPAACTGGCNGSTCVVNCNSAAACQGSVINCPPGFACDVSCAGSDGCSAATINCPDNYACVVSCGANSSCRNGIINCSATGTCDVSCSNATQVCRDAQINCDGNACTATCASTQFPPTSNCGPSCGCTACP
jgi:hypothetical protein